MNQSSLFVYSNLVSRQVSELKFLTGINSREISHWVLVVFLFVVTLSRVSLPNKSKYHWMALKVSVAMCVFDSYGSHSY